MSERASGRGEQACAASVPLERVVLRSTEICGLTRSARYTHTLLRSAQLTYSRSSHGLNTKHQPTEPSPHTYHTNKPKMQNTGSACTEPQNHTFLAPTAPYPTDLHHHGRSVPWLPGAKRSARAVRRHMQNGAHFVGGLLEQFRIGATEKRLHC